MVAVQRVVGSSAMRSSGFVLSAIAISRAGACRPTAVDNASARRAGSETPTSPEHLDGTRPGLAPGDRGAASDDLGDLVATGEDRVEAGHRLLEDHADRAAADVAHSSSSTFSRSRRGA